MCVVKVWRPKSQQVLLSQMSMRCSVSKTLNAIGRCWLACHQSRLGWCAVLLQESMHSTCCNWLKVLNECDGGLGKASVRTVAEKTLKDVLVTTVRYSITGVY